MIHPPHSPFFFFFNDTATTEIYTLSLHDALPISEGAKVESAGGDCQDDEGRKKHVFPNRVREDMFFAAFIDRKSTRLNSSHQIISYAVFCLKKKTVLRASRRLNPR